MNPGFGAHVPGDMRADAGRHPDRQLPSDERTPAMTTPPAEMTKAEADTMLAALTAELVQAGNSPEDAQLFAAAKVRAAKAEIRRSNKKDEPRENATFAFLDVAAASLLRASEQFDLPDDAWTYVTDLADVFQAIAATDSTYLSGTLRTRSGDVAIMPKPPRARRNRDGQNNGAATPAPAK